MKKYVYLSITILSILLFLGISSRSSYAQEDTTSEPGSKLILYVLDTCPYCEALLLDLESENALEYVVIKEASGDPNRAEILEVANTCRMRASVPMLYDGERCYQGRYIARDKIFEFAGIESDLDQADPKEQLITDLDEEEEVPVDESDLLTTDNQDVDRTIPESTTTDDLNEENVDSNNLADRLGINEEPNLREIPPLTIIASLLAPLILIGLGYLIVTKMKV